MITVHHLNNSRSQRVLWLLEELGVPYEVRRYERDPQTMLAPASLKAVHPLGKSPVITDGEVTLAESGAIVEYLAGRYGGGRLLPPEGVSLRNVSNERAGMTVVGPKARDILQGLTETSLANADFPWFAVKSVNLGLASDVRMLRINYSGELGWEIYCPMQYQRSLIAQIFAAGEPHGLKPVGTQALESLRLEKSYRAMYRDMNGELTAWESSLDRFIALDKGDFIGRAALLAGKPARRSVTVKIPSDGASLIGGESLYRDGKLVGRILSGSYSYTFGHDIGIALLPAESRPGDSFALTLLGKPHQATVIEESPYDPQSLRARG